jgi:hypothetical protein
MKRRDFIVAFMAVTALAAIPGTKAISSTYNPQTPIIKTRDRRKTKNLKPGAVQVAEPDSVINLPEDARHGDQIHIVVEANSLKKPSFLACKNAKIDGDMAELELDSLAILHLTFNAAKNNWQLS